MLRLQFCGGRFGERSVLLREGRTTVGRGPGNLLRIVDQTVSATHCEIYVWGNDLIVRDLGSRNGTWVGAQVLHNRQCGVKVGDLVRFGNVPARLEFTPRSKRIAALDRDLEDITAIHHYSKFMRTSLARERTP